MMFCANCGAELDRVPSSALEWCNDWCYREWDSDLPDPDPMAGPFRLPSIECSDCGVPHHIQRVNKESGGFCIKCGAELRRPTDAELKQLDWHSAWNRKHADRQSGIGTVFDDE